MKKISILLLSIVFLTAFQCENEPLEGDFVSDAQFNCATAVENSIQASLNFASATNDMYQDLCNAYLAALNAQIQACGDSNGALQQLIDSLGNCAIDVPSECEATTTAAQTAASNYSNATINNYTDLCNLYLAALQNQITSCGDTDGTIQNTIDGIGDCTQNLNIEISLTAGTLPIYFDIVDVVEEGNSLKVTGRTSANGASNYEIYFEVNQGETGIDIINNAFYLTLTSTFYPNTDGFDDFTSNITENTSGSLNGTFGGIVTNADGGDLSLTQGVINITY